MKFFGVGAGRGSHFCPGRGGACIPGANAPFPNHSIEERVETIVRTGKSPPKIVKDIEKDQNNIFGETTYSSFWSQKLDLSAFDLSTNHLKNKIHLIGVKYQYVQFSRQKQQSISVQFSKMAKNSYKLQIISNVGQWTSYICYMIPLHHIKTTSKVLNETELVPERHGVIRSPTKYEAQHQYGCELKNMN